jgi:hypothetical protein
VALSGNAYGASSSVVYGLFGSAQNTSTGEAYGGYFKTTTSGTGDHYGVRCEGNGASSAYVRGIYGKAVNTGSGSTIAGQFLVPDDGTGNHYGVYASATTASDGYAYGVLGSANTSGAGNAYGGHFSAGGVGAGSRFGIYSFALQIGNYAAGYFDGLVHVTGNLQVEGTKSAVVQTGDREYRAIYCQESPENWFEDFGEGQLASGQTHIDLDPVFLKTVTIDATSPMKVFVQLEGDCKGVYVTKGTTGFDVKELQAGTSNVAFSFRVVAKRKGFENLRLETVSHFTAEEQEAMRNDAEPHPHDSAPKEPKAEE